MEYEVDVDMDGVNKLLSFNPSKIRQHPRGNGWTTEVKETRRDKERVKDSKQGRPEVYVARNKRFKSETVFYYSDLKIAVVDGYYLR